MATSTRKSAAKTANPITPIGTDGNVVERNWEVGTFLTAKFTMKEEDFIALIKQSKWDHYVYGLCLDNGAVFYVGKGVGSRATTHSKEASRGDDSEKSRYIRKIGGRLRYTVFLQCSDDAFAMGYEAYLIHGHHDVLTNIAPASEAAYQRMFQPIDPFQKSLETLAWVDNYIKKADAECKAAMLDIIKQCHETLNKLTREEIEWVGMECAIHD